MSAASMDDGPLGLSRRGPNSLPAAWIASLKHHPKHLWGVNANLGGVILFWLNKHRSLKETLGAINTLLGKAAERQFDLIENLPDLHQLLLGFGQEFELHHHAEDHHYFPLYARAAPELIKGFDLLENDHQLLHEALLDTFTCAREIFHRAHRDHRVHRDLIVAMGASSGRLHKYLIRHLDDEEDVVVPFVLSRGEDTLFGIGSSSKT